MPAAAEISPAVVAAPPEWSTIAEDVFCPLCDYNLRGLIEPRCPECGFRFDWPDLLDPTRRKHPFVFEHHPERNFRSFLQTTRAVFRPAKFWRTLHPAQPSHAPRLVRFWVYSSIFVWIALVGIVGSKVINVVRQQKAARVSMIAYYQSPSYPASAVQGINRNYGSIQAFVNTTVPVFTYSQALRRVVLRSLSLIEGPAALLGIMLCWPWLSFLALMIFKISMDRARVKNVHVLRAVMYSAPPILICPIPALILGVAIDLAVADRLVGFSVSGLLFALSVVVGLVLYACALAAAYAHYLKFDHPRATVVAAQIVLLLTVLTAFAVVFTR